MPLDLLVPNLLPPADAPPEMKGLRLPALERWLGAARRERVSVRSAYDWIAAEYALPSPAPVAAISLAAEGDPGDAAWLRADPVHIRIDRNAVQLHAPAVLAVRPDEARALVEALDRHFGDDGLAFLATAPERWYVRVPENELPATTPLDQVVGRSAHEHFPRSKGSINWRTALTESQMLLGAHEVNAARESRREPAINSVWFWGEGRVPARIARRYDVVAATDAFARGLAKASGASLAATTKLSDDLPGSTRVLALVDGPARAFERTDLAAWQAAALDAERDWFGNFDPLLRRFGEVRVILPGERDTLVATLAPPSLFDRFRSPKPLISHG